MVQLGRLSEEAPYFIRYANEISIQINEKEVNVNETSIEIDEITIHIDDITIRIDETWSTFADFFNNNQ